jgi:hypothetical protein
LSLTLPSSYSAAVSKPSIKENWLIQLGYNDFPTNTNHFVGLSFYDTEVSSEPYYGAVTGNLSIRTSIDLANSKASTGNITITVANFEYLDSDFSVELLSGTRTYINRAVKIYSQIDDESTLSNCLQIYEGRLVDISSTDKTVTLKIIEKQPWDYISIPNVKTSTSKRYFPVAYGSFDNSTASTISSPDFCTNKSLFPLPVDSFGVRDVYALLPHSSSVTDGKLFYYESALDKFIPIYDDDYYQTSVAYEGGYASRNKSTLKRAVKYRPTTEGSGNDWTDSEKSYDGSTSGSDYSTYQRSTSMSNNDTNNHKDQLILNVPNIDHSCNEFKQKINYSFIYSATGTPHANSYIKIVDQTYGVDTALSTRTTPGTTAQSTSSYQAYTENGQLPSSIIWELETNGVTVMGYSATVIGTGKIWDVECASEHQVSASQKGSEGKHVELLYSGADGLTNSFNGGSGVADTGLEAHRDLLKRFTDYDDTDANIFNYASNLDVKAARITSAWNIRWWALEPTELKTILERIQYEFCFIWKWRHDGTGSVWYVKDSYSSGDIAETLSSDDIDNIKVSTTPFSELLTKMEINYEKHPADDSRYLNSITAVDDENEYREKWYGSQGTKENIAQVDLEMNVNKPGQTNPGDGDPNDGFSNYYMNIFGTIKTQVSVDIINHNKGYKLETGDIVAFDNSNTPMKPFGGSWSNKYYMITNLVRSPGKISIDCREVNV